MKVFPDSYYGSSMKRIQQDNGIESIIYFTFLKGASGFYEWVIGVSVEAESVTRLL